MGFPSMGAKMQSTLVISDLHLSSNPRDRYRHNILKRVATKDAPKLGVRRTLILGDLTEAKDRHNDWLTNRVSDHVHRFAELGDVIILQGNHDYLTSPNLPFFHFLRRMPNVRWINRPTSFSLDGLGRTLWLPHTRNHRADWKGLSFDNFDYIFAHNTFVGARMEHGRVAEGGIPTKLFPRGAKIISGDVHVPQTTGPITYVGAPYSIDFGDSFQGRALILDGSKMTSYQIKGPQKVLFDIDAIGNPDYDGNPNAGDILKVRVTIARSKVADWPRIRDEIRQWAVRVECKVHAVTPIIVEDATTKQKRIRRAEVKSDREVMREFSDHQKIGTAMRKYGERLL